MQIQFQTVAPTRSAPAESLAPPAYNDDCASNDLDLPNEPATEETTNRPGLRRQRLPVVRTPQKNFIPFLVRSRRPPALA